MIIVCPCGEKKFEVKDNQIPEKGRRLKCGYCNKEWFFIKNIEKRKNEQLQNPKIDIEEEKDNSESKATKAIKTKETSKVVKSTNLNKRKSNYFKLFIVIIISLIGLIVILDTFKNQLIILIPNISEILDNLYESLTDLKLFIKDLIK